MLQQLREKAKSFVSYALLILLVLSFAVWGIGDIFRRGGGKDWVAKIGDAKISSALLNREFRNQNAQLRMALGAEFTTKKALEMGLLDRALDRLVTVASFNLETNRLGFRIGDEQILKTLQETKELRNEDGSFNRMAFERLLRSQGLSEEGFIDMQKQIVARNMLLSGLALPVAVPDLVVSDLAAAAAQRRVAELVRINPEQMEAGAAPGEEELKKFYEENKTGYQVPEVRNFSVLRLMPEDAAKDVAVSEEDLKKAYEDRQDELGTPESRNLLQVVTGDEATAKTLAEADSPAALKEAAKAKELEAVSLPGMKKKDLPDGLAGAVFQRAASKAGTPVQSQLGWHVFFVEKVNAANIPSFEAARGKLHDELSREKSSEVLVQIANKVDDMLAGGKTPDDVAASLSLKIKKFENRDAGGRDVAESAADGETPDAETLKAAFGYAEGESSPLMEEKDGGYLLVHVDKVTAPHPEAFEKVKERLAKDMATQARAKKAASLAQDILNKLKGGAPLSEIKGEGVTISTSSGVAADDVKQTAVPREALAPLFGMKKGETAAISIPAGEMVVRVKEILPGSREDIDARKGKIKTALAQDWVNTHIDELAAALRNIYPVEVDRKAIERSFSDENG